LYEQFHGIELEAATQTLTDLDEEYEGQDPSPFDTAMAPSRMGKRSKTFRWVPKA